MAKQRQWNKKLIVVLAIGGFLILAVGAGYFREAASEGP